MGVRWCCCEKLGSVFLYISDWECVSVDCWRVHGSLCFHWFRFMVRHLNVDIVTELWMILTFYVPMSVILDLIFLVLLSRFIHLVGFLFIFEILCSIHRYTSTRKGPRMTGSEEQAVTVRITLTWPDTQNATLPWERWSPIWYILPFEQSKLPSICYNGICTEILAVVNHVT